jgi:hypothetical protein
VFGADLAVSRPGVFTIMLPSEQKLVEEVIERITVLQQARRDSLDWVEMIVELQEEFGTEAVRWACRFLVARGMAEDRRMAEAARGPLWDRDLDGRVKSTVLLE